MSANPPILSVPPRRVDPNSNVYQYLEDFTPHLPELAQEGYDQFEYNYHHGSDPIYSYRQGDGSSSVLDRQALIQGVEAGEGGPRVIARKMEEVQEQSGFDRRWADQEEALSRKNNREYELSAPSDTRRYHSPEHVAASTREVSRHASAPLVEQHVNRRRRREGVEALAARRAKEAKERRRQQEGDDEDATESAGRLARKMRRREKAAIRQPPPLRISTPPAEPPYRRSRLESSVDSRSEPSEPRVAKRTRVLGDDLVKNYRSEHVTKGRLTLRPDQTKGQGFLGKAKFSGAILGAHDRGRGQAVRQHGTSDADWEDKWRPERPADHSRSSGSRQPAGVTGTRPPEANAGDQQHRPTQRELDIVRNCHIPQPGHTASPSWRSSLSERVSQHQATVNHLGRPYRLPVLPSSNTQVEAEQVHRPDKRPQQASDNQPILPRLHPPPGGEGSLQSISYLQAAHPSAVPASTPWQPRPASGFGQWSTGYTPFGKTVRHEPTSQAALKTHDLALALEQQLMMPTATLKARPSEPTLQPASEPPSKTSAVGIPTMQQVHAGTPLHQAQQDREIAGEAASAFNQKLQTSQTAARPHPLIQLTSVDDTSSPRPGQLPIKPLIRLDHTQTPRPLLPISTSRPAPLVQLRRSNDRPATYPAVQDSANIRRPFVTPIDTDDPRTFEPTEGVVNPVYLDNLRPADQVFPRHAMTGSSYQNLGPADQSMSSPQVGPPAAEWPAHKFQLDAGLHNPFTDSQNPFVAPGRSWDAGRPFRPPSSFAQSPAASSSLARFPAPSSTPMRFGTPAANLQISVGQSDFAIPSRNFLTHANVPVTPRPFAQGTSSTLATMMLNNPPTTGPIPATPMAKHVEEDLAHFWSKRPAFR